MLPLVLDVARLPLMLVGNGTAALRRLRLLDEAGAADLVVHAEAAAPDLADAAGNRLVRRLPDAAEIATARLVFIAGMDPARRTALAAEARKAGVLVHVEDEPALCDVHAPAVLRRGDLLIAVSTGGASPALAGHLKRFLGGLFGPEWQRHLADLAALRRTWRATGIDPVTVMRWTEEWVSRQDWLPGHSPPSAATRPASTGRTPSPDAARTVAVPN